MKVNRNPFPVNMVTISASSKGKGLAGPSDRPERTQADRRLAEEEVARQREFRPTSHHLTAIYSGRYWKGVRRQQHMAKDAQYPPEYFLSRGCYPRQPEDFDDRRERMFREHWNYPFFWYCWDEGFTRLPTVEDCPECATCHTSRGMPSVFRRLP